MKRSSKVVSTGRIDGAINTVGCRVSVLECDFRVHDFTMVPSDASECVVQLRQQVRGATRSDVFDRVLSGLRAVLTEIADDLASLSLVVLTAGLAKSCRRERQQQDESANSGEAWVQWTISPARIV